MVDWANLNRQLSYFNDGLQFGLDVFKAHKSGQNIGESLSTAGINLFGNTAATRNAAELRAHTGSNLGYVAKHAAGDNAQQAVFNTTQASAQMWQWDLMGCPYNRGYYSPMASRWDMQMPATYYPAPTFPGDNVYNSSFFQRNWFC